MKTTIGLLVSFMFLLSLVVLYISSTINFIYQCLKLTKVLISIIFLGRVGHLLYRSFALAHQKKSDQERFALRSLHKERPRAIRTFDLWAKKNANHTAFLTTKSRWFARNAWSECPLPTPGTMWGKMTKKWWKILEVIKRVATFNKWHYFTVYSLFVHLQIK